MTNTPISASAEQKPASPANPHQGDQQGRNPRQNQGGNKASADKTANEAQQK